MKLFFTVVFNAILILFIATNFVFSQSITVNADNYRHQFQGVGTSIGLYIGHHFSMAPENQDKAIQLMAKDCNMVYLQDYMGEYPDEKPSAFDKPANYFKAAKAYRPELKVSIVLNRFPDNLIKMISVDGSDKKALDVERDSIYDQLADWYFEVLRGFKERNVEVDIINMVNEPDWNKQYYFGYNDPKKGVAFILKEAVPKLKAMLNDPDKNKLGIKVPLVMAPSTLATGACLTYVKYFKDKYPDAWGQVDIVATHQYGGGSNRGTFDKIQAELDGRLFFQSEMHADRGDNLGNMPVDRPLRTALSFASLFAASVNGGVESWYYFINNYPHTFHPGGLIQVQWGGAPIPYKHYYAFKQMTSMMPTNIHLVERTLDSSFDTNDVMSFRKKGEDTVYLNVSNFGDKAKSVIIQFEGSANSYGVKSIRQWTTDKDLSGDVSYEETFSKSRNKHIVSLKPYSVNTFKVAIDTTGAELAMEEQFITFDSIPDFKQGDGDYTLKASANSGLDVQFEVVSGPATITNGTLSLDSVGIVVVKATQSGNDSYLNAPEVYNTFYVWPNGLDNVALNKSVTVDNEKSPYLGTKAVDGDKESDDSRWLTNDVDYPHWIEVDLGDSSTISSFAFWNGWNSYNNPIFSFDLKAWNGKEWVVVHSAEGNNNPVYLGSFPEVNTRKIRLELKSGGDKIVRMYELEVYGKAIVDKITSVQGISIQEVKVFPNPFKDKLSFKIDIAKPTNVGIEIYTVNGQKVFGFKKEKMQPGHHSIVWDIKSNAKGKVANKLFMVRLQIGDVQETRKVILEE